MSRIDEIDAERRRRAEHASLDIQIEEVEREIRMRNDVYPRQVHTGKMRASVADEHIRRMKAVRETLIRLRNKGETP